MSDKEEDIHSEHFAAPALYVVATPIGNLGDISLRALACLRAADIIACEDTRHSRTLLDHFGIQAPCFALHEHNEKGASETILSYLAAEKRVALITDAGTPGISDPGARAVAAAHSAGYRVVPLPGASAGAALLSVAGLADQHVLFVGFLPPKSAARRSELAELKDIPAALVFYEAPHRILETVDDLLAVLGPQRTLVVGRELTKRFEEVARLPLSEAPAWFAATSQRERGEFVLAVSAPPPRHGLDADSERILRVLLAEMPLKQATRLAALITGQSRGALYTRALEIRGD